jgi:type VI secretion system secreted protein VgrG
MEPDWEKAPAPQAVKMESYRFPHLYQSKAEGERYAEIQLLRQLTYREWIEGEGDVSRLTPGHAFMLNNHPRVNLNRVWWIFEVSHHGDQPGVLEHEAPSDRGMRYNAAFSAIPSETRFVPENKHKKVKVDGVQSAIVTGPAGEEIYPDKYGRVKVQFFWDRLGQADEKTSCWIRVSQGWAGSQFGMTAIPRIGQEVLVSFLEGNPDRPLITGRVYNELLMPPYTLPEHKTRSVFKSMSTPGEKDEKRGFNELRIEDMKGKEEIYVHAEKDINMYVQNDLKEHILHDRHQIIDHFTYLETIGETHEIMRNHRKVELHADDNLTIKGSSHIEVEEKWLMKTKDEIHIKSNTNIILEADAELTIKAGGQWIRLDPSGIKTSSIFHIGQGSAGNGTGASPEKPDGAHGTEAGLRIMTKVFKLHPEMKEVMKNAMSNAQANSQPVIEQCSLS